MFDQEILNYAKISEHDTWWVNSLGEPIETSSGVTVNDEFLQQVIQGERLADPSTLYFHDTSKFRAGELHRHYQF